MIRLLRIVGFLTIGTGLLLIAAWMIGPLRRLWPWFLSLPWPIRLGLGAAAAGLLLLLGTVIWERLEDRESDPLLDDDPLPPSHDPGDTP